MNGYSLCAILCTRCKSIKKNDGLLDALTLLHDDNRTLHRLRATQHRDISHTVLARGPPCPLLKRMEQFLNAFRKQVPGHRPKPTAAWRPQPKDTTGHPSTKSSPPDKPFRPAGA